MTESELQEAGSEIERGNREGVNENVVFVCACVCVCGVYVCVCVGGGLVVISTHTCSVYDVNSSRLMTTFYHQSQTGNLPSQCLPSLEV